ncbi:MAG TPA: hypothetical protein VJ741_18615 [Solirubrobacteraceae bacterium]|nr:hypothetical protein [Solirubrobacteraceae bacterium]
MIRTIPVGGEPHGVSSDGKDVWVAAAAVGSGFGVAEIDASTETVIRRIPISPAPFGISSDGTHVWAADTASSGAAVTEIAASSGAVLGTIPVGDSPFGVSSDGTHVWVTSQAAAGTVTEIDASSGAVVNTISVGSSARGVSSDGTHVWVGNGGDGTVSEIDASTGAVVNTIGIGGFPQGVSADGTHVWVATGVSVVEIDAATGRILGTIPFGNDTFSDAVSSDGTHVWVTHELAAGTVSEIDASTGRVVQTIPVGSDPSAVSSDGSLVWTANAATGTGNGTVSEIEIGAEVPIVSVTDDSGGVSAGGSFTYTATVTGRDGVAPTGTADAVAWTVTGPKGTAVPCASITGPAAAGEVATYTCTIAGAHAGGYTATAAYPGDENYSAASGTDDSADVMPGTLTQGPPTTATVLKGTAYSSQLFVTNAVGSVSFTEDSAAGAAVVKVGPAGTIFVSNTAPAGTYAVGGTDSDSLGDTGTWTFTLTILAQSCGVVVASVGDAPPVGTVVQLGQVIRTGSNSHVTLRWPNGSTLNLSENSEVKCDSYIAGAGNDQGDQSFFSVLKGAFVWLSGEVGKNRENVLVPGGQPIGCICIRGSVFTGAVLPDGKLLVHLIQGIGTVRIGGKTKLEFPAGEGILVDPKTKKYTETLRLPPSAASLIPPVDRPPSITTLRATGRAHAKPVLRFRLSESAAVKVILRHGQHTARVLKTRGNKGQNQLTLSKALPPGQYGVEVDAVHQGLAVIQTTRLRIQ